MTSWTFALAAGLALLAATAHAQDERLHGTSPRLDLAVRAAVQHVSQLTVFDVVRASVHEGVVVLTGKVTAASKRDAVHRTVSAIDGVRRVDDLVVVLPASKADDELRDRLARDIYGDARFWRYAAMVSPPIRIIVEAGHVTLTGTVQTMSDRSLAHALAMQSGAGGVAVDIEIR